MRTTQLTGGHFLANIDAIGGSTGAFCSSNRNEVDAPIVEAVRAIFAENILTRTAQLTGGHISVNIDATDVTGAYCSLDRHKDLALLVEVVRAIFAGLLPISTAQLTGGHFSANIDTTEVHLACRTDLPEAEAE